MKRSTIDLRERQRRLARFRAAGRERLRKTARLPTPYRYIHPGQRIIAPRSFNLTRGAGLEVTKFLHAVATAVLTNGYSVVLDFRDTGVFYAPATILLFAELDRIVALSKLPKPITILDPRRRRPREVLKQIGLHELTGDICETVPEREDVVYWKATKGENQSGDQFQELEVVAARVNREHANQVKVNGVWRAVSEAIANSVEHAYTMPRKDGFSGLDQTKWWMFTQLRDSIFTVAVCDLGCGYRATIAENLPEQFIASLAAALRWSNRDSLAIQTAMEYGRSGTQQGHRGKGSRDAISVLEAHGAGELMILSNTGWMRYKFEDGKECEKDQGKLRISIGGSIVWWKLPLKEVASESG